MLAADALAGSLDNPSAATQACLNDIVAAQLLKDTFEVLPQVVPTPAVLRYLVNAGFKYTPVGSNYKISWDRPE